MSDGARRIWQEKLDFLLAEEAKTSDPELAFLLAEEAKTADAEQKFALKQRIAEARTKIRELGGV